MTPRQAKARAYRLAAEFLRSDLAAGAVLATDEAEEKLIGKALDEVIEGLYTRAEALEQRPDRHRLR